MAPRFRQLLFQTYAEEHGATGFIGFPADISEQMPRFRDALCNGFHNSTRFQYRTDILGPFENDVYVRFFDNNNADAVNAFYSKPLPGCFSWLLRTRQYREHKAEEARVKLLIHIEISTSHDYPCVVIDKSNLTEGEIAQIIEKAAQDLKLNIVRCQVPYSMDIILRSNQSFGARK